MDPNIEYEIQINQFNIIYNYYEYDHWNYKLDNKQKSIDSIFNRAYKNHNLSKTQTNKQKTQMKLTLLMFSIVW